MAHLIIQMENQWEMEVNAQRGESTRADVCILTCMLADNVYRLCFISRLNISTASEFFQAEPCMNRGNFQLFPCT